MREIAIKSIIAFLLLAARVASAQGTTTFLSNIGQPSSGSQTVGSDSWFAAGFVTGTDASGYLLDSIQLGMASSTGSPSGFTVMLYEDAGSPAGLSPGSSLGTFMGSLDPCKWWHIHIYCAGRTNTIGWLRHIILWLPLEPQRPQVRTSGAIPVPTITTQPTVFLILEQEWSGFRQWNCLGTIRLVIFSIH